MITWFSHQCLPPTKEKIYFGYQSHAGGRVILIKSTFQSFGNLLRFHYHWKPNTNSNYITTERCEIASKITARSVRQSDAIKCNVASITNASYDFKYHLENNIRY